MGEEPLKFFLLYCEVDFRLFKKKEKKDSLYLERSLKIIQDNYIKLSIIGREIIKNYKVLPSVTKIFQRIENMYKNLEVDHIFRIVEDDGEAINKILLLGFSASEIREHTGQGTSSRFIFFEKNYLELIYLRSREESQNNFVKFHERVDNFRNKSGSPYGIGFRGKLSEIEKNDFEFYEPKYNLSGNNFTIYMHSSYFTNPEMPAIFFLEVNNSTKEDFYPINKGVSCEKYMPLNKFTDVKLISPILKDESFGNFEIQKGDEEKLLINGKFAF